MCHFNPRSPRGGATLSAQRYLGHANAFQSTLPTRGSDAALPQTRTLRQYFNPRSPRGGATPCAYRGVCCPTYFNPRSPRGGATRNWARADAEKGHFNPRSPRGGATIYVVPRLFGGLLISIHAPHEGERQRKSAFVCSISANLLNIIHCGTVTRAVSRRRIALFRLFSVRRSGVFMYACASH